MEEGAGHTRCFWNCNVHRSHLVKMQILMQWVQGYGVRFSFSNQLSGNADAAGSQAWLHLEPPGAALTIPRDTDVVGLGHSPDAGVFLKPRDAQVQTGLRTPVLGGVLLGK